MIKSQGRIFYSIGDAEAEGFSAAFLSDLPEIEAGLRSRLAKIDPEGRIALKLVERIERASGAAADAEGAYVDRLIRIAVEPARRGRGRWVLDHEIVHGLRDLRVIDDAEWGVLSRAASQDAALMRSVRERYADEGLTEEQLVEEAVADMFADWSRGREARQGPVRALLERIAAFFRAVARTLKLRGYNGAADIFEAIERGDIGARTPRAAQSPLDPHTGWTPFEAGADPDFGSMPSVALAKGVQVADQSALGTAALRYAPFVAGAIEMRRRMEELGRQHDLGTSPDNPPPSPATPPFTPGELQTPGFPSKPPIDPEEFNKETKPAEPIVVRGTAFPAEPQDQPLILIFPDLSDEFGKEIMILIRKGNSKTRAEVMATHKYIKKHYPDYVWLGGGTKKEHWFPGPGAAWKDEDGRWGDGRPGGKWADLAYRRPDGSILVIQIVDVDRNGNPTKRELDNAEAIRRLSNRDQKIDVHLIPKMWQMRGSR